MNLKRKNASGNTITRNQLDLDAGTGNVYESIAIMSQRANQLGAEIKEELSKKLEDFASYTDNLEEVFENREQIEISRYYEKLPKPSLMAIQEFLNGEIYFRLPEQKEGEKEQKS